MSIVFMNDKDVSLRPIVKEDAKLFERWVNDPDVRDYMNAYLPMSLSEEEEWIEGLTKRKNTNIVFMVVVEDVSVATMGIHNISYRDGTAVTGAMMGEKEYWGKGYGSKAKRLLLEYAFLTLNLRKITSGVVAFNERSIAYNLKCGYKEEGRFKDQFFRKGKYYDEVMFAIFREDWVKDNQEWLEGR